MRPAATDTAGQVRRLLQLLPTYAGRGEVPIDEVAASLDVDAAVIRKDLRALEDYEDRGGFVEKFKVTIGETRLSVEARTFRRPMRLTREEMRALELGLSLLRHERAGPERAAVDAALAQLRQLLVVPGTPEAEIAGDQSAGAPGLLALVKQARAKRQVLRMMYAPAGAPAAERRVHVYATVVAAGMWYAIARNPASGGVRAYRLDRISSAAQEDETFAVPDDFDVDLWLHDGRVLQAADAPLLRVRYSAAVARWIAERERRPLAADGTLEIAHPLADRAWAVRHLLQYGAEVEVLEPAELRSALVAALDQLLAADSAAR